MSEDRTYFRWLAGKHEATSIVFAPKVVLRQIAAQLVQALFERFAFAPKLFRLFRRERMSPGIARQEATHPDVSSHDFGQVGTVCLRSLILIIFQVRRGCLVHLI